MYLIGSKDFLRQEDHSRLLKYAKAFEPDEEARFIDSVGWEDWMEDFCGDPTEKIIGEDENKRIDQVLHEVFEEAQDEMDRLYLKKYGITYRDAYYR